MISLLEVMERAQNGKIVDEKEWNMGVFNKLTALTKKYEIHRQKDEWINTDDEILERAFAAAIEFIVETGVYCRDLKRVLRFSETEVKDALEEAPHEITVGDGKEKTTITQKKIEGTNKMNVTGGGHVPFSLEWIPLAAKNFALLPRIDYMEGMNFKEVEGRPISNQGIAAYAQIRAIQAQREGLEMAGKPGLAVALYPISTTPVCMTSALGMNKGLRSSDGALLSPLPDFKIESGYITTAIVYDDYGLRLRVNGSDGFCGATFVGSPQNAIVENLAKVIISWICYRDTLHSATVKHTDTLAGKWEIYGEVSWACTVAIQALNRYTNCIAFTDGTFVHEIGTIESFKEIAIKAVRGTVSGANIWSTYQDPQVNCTNSPLEVQFYIEVADAVVDAGLKRTDANKLIADWVQELDRKGPPKMKGLNVHDVFDLHMGEPKKEFNDTYERMKAELRERGLNL